MWLCWGGLSQGEGLRFQKSMPFPGFSLGLLLADGDVSSQLFHHELNTPETINSINAFLNILPSSGCFVTAILE